MYYRFLYRPLMKLAHRFNWHHTRTVGPFPDGSYVIRCDWCGLTHRTPPFDYATLAINVTDLKPEAKAVLYGNLDKLYQK